MLCYHTRLEPSCSLLSSLSASFAPHPLTNLPSAIPTSSHPRAPPLSHRQTVLGSAKMVLQTGKHCGALKDMTCSPAGTTIAGIHELERAGTRAAFMNAVYAATQRADELAKSG